VESKGIFPLRSCTFTLYFNANGDEFLNAIEKQLNHSKLKVHLLNGKTT
jgi:hypothetical protein